MSLPQHEMLLAGALAEDLRSIGFDMEQLSPDSYSIQGVPAQIADRSPVPVLMDILEQVRERGADTRSEWREQIAQSIAASGAIPYGKTLTETEMRDLLTRLLQLPQYRRTHDGKTIVSLLTDEEINKKFQ
jgi:DNA mismatch repair protein MutL